MKEAKGVPKKIYLLQRITVPRDLHDEFNQFWKEKALFVWEEQGAKLILAATTFVGGPSAEITHLFEFEDLHHWQRMQEATWAWWEKEEGAGRGSPPKGLLRYVTNVEQKLLRGIY